MNDDSNGSTDSKDDDDQTAQWSASSAGLPKDETPQKSEVSRVFAGRYRADREIGVGGFGAVYAGYDSQLRRAVAIKVARPDRVSNSTEAFLREARHLAQLSHESILRVYDVGLDNDERFIVTDLVDGVDLHLWMQSNPPSFQQIAAIIAQVADGLAHAHSQRIVHRDVKPGNILMSSDGNPVLADFGLALAEEEMAFGPVRQVRGTVAYMSPEQARGEGHRIDGRTDIYSLGIVLYEMLCGRRPFRASSRTELLRQVRDDEPQPPRQLNRRIPEPLERICLRAMSKRVKDRYVTASDLAAELRNLEDPNSPTAVVHTQADTQQPSDQRETSSRDSSSTIRVVPKGARSFDRGDHDFFLELIPGPRDSGGLPESLRFWKNRVEPRETVEGFPVGVLYGPSGCGKSSLVRAGLLPNLDSNVRSIWLEASANDTESKLTRALRKCFRGVSQDAPLNELMAAIRGEQVSRGRKTLIVIDQFEQWLNEHSGDMSQTDLANALRQADGNAVQVLLLVRDDFWLGVTRLFEFLELKLDPDFNTRCVDLFDKRHAHRVLAAFGYAYGQLPESRGQLSDEQSRFLDQAVDELSEDGLVVPVRLSLFAELMKSRPWTLRTLRDVGGTQGVGVRFLEESFASRSASPENRLLEKHARALLTELLPVSGSQIRGKMRSRAELASTCQLDAESSKLDRLLEILDRQLHIVTPAEPVEMSLETAADTDTNSDSITVKETYYQLTHDYLVGSLRQWLTFERRKTWRGRAEMRLEELAEQMRQWPRSNYRPSLREYVLIVCGVPHRKRNADQRELMRQATRYHVTRGAAATFASVALVTILVLAFAQLKRGQQIAGLEHQVASLLVETPAEARRLLDSLDDQSNLAKGPLEKALGRRELSEKQKLRLGLALGREDLVLAGLLSASPDELQLVVDEFSPSAELQANLAKTVADTRREQSQRLRAAAVLASWNPEDGSIAASAEAISTELVSQDLLEARKWIALLRPASKELKPHLRSVFGDQGRASAALFAAAALADFSAGDLAELVNLLRDSQPAQIGVIAEQISAQAGGIATLTAEAERTIATADQPVSQRLLTARQSAKAAIALVICGQGETLVRKFLGPSPKPDARSYFIQLAPAAEISPQIIGSLLDGETEPTRLAALVQILGGYHPSSLPPAARAQMEAKLKLSFVEQAHSGLHYSIDWLLRKWGVSMDELKEPSRDPVKDNMWFHTPSGHDMVVIDAPGRIRVRSLTSMDEEQMCEIPYRFAIGAKEVTFRDTLASDNPGRLPTEIVEGRPADFVTLDVAAEYCNWLSIRDGFSANDVCYDIEDSGIARLRPDFLERRGYRLPLTQEAEYAARSMTTSSRFFGDDVDLLPAYSATMKNYRGSAVEVGSFLPNEFGLFDSIGNVTEQCHYVVKEAHALYLRGSHFRGSAEDANSTYAVRVRAGFGNDIVGMRIVRKLDFAK